MYVSQDLIGESLAKARSLKAFHINFTLKTRTEELPEISPEELIPVVERCSSTVMQIGCNTRVWQVNVTFSVSLSSVTDSKVEREFVNEDGRIVTRIHLGRYDNPEVPEQFRVVQI